MQIAVGGCLAQKDRDTIVKKAPWVDVVFGTHNIGKLPVLLERARVQEEAQVEIAESLEAFPSTLPTRRESAYAAWVSISVGCNNTCTFCIVPALRGKEKDRRPGDILAEVEALVAEGVSEITLLGQNVNAYGSDIGDREAFSKLLRACGNDRGPGAGPLHLPAPARLHRRRHRGHGRDAERDAAAAHAAAVRLGHGPEGDAPLVPPGALPRHHREGPRRDPARRHLHRHHRGLPRRDRGGLRADAARGARGPLRAGLHLPVLQAARHPGRRRWTGQIPKEVVQERYERLVALQEEISWEENKKQVGRTLEVMVAEGEGRKDGATHRLSGRAPDNRLVHFTKPDEDGPPRRRGDRRDHLRRAAPPAGRGPDPGRPPHPRGRRLGEAQRRRRREAGGRACSACPTIGVPGAAAGAAARLRRRLTGCADSGARAAAPRAPTSHRGG